jgi:hypothetical protein
LKENEYNDARVYVDYEEEATTIKVQTKMDDDSQVSELSTKFKQYLIDQNIIEDEESITQQKVT